MALTADNLGIIGEGRILQTTTVSDFVEEHSRDLLSVVTPDAERMQAMFANSPSVRITETTVEDGYPADSRAFRIEGADFAAVAHGFARSQIVAYRFTREQVSLEQAYMELTHAHAQYVSAPMTAAGAQIPQNMPMQNMPVQNMGNGGAR